MEINRPDKANAMSSAFFTELKQCFDGLAIDPACRAVVICGSGAVRYEKRKFHREAERKPSYDTPAKITRFCCRQSGNEKRNVQNEHTSLMRIFTSGPRQNTQEIVACGIDIGSLEK